MLDAAKRVQMPTKPLQKTLNATIAGLPLTLASSAHDAIVLALILQGNDPSYPKADIALAKELGMMASRHHLNALQANAPLCIAYGMGVDSTAVLVGLWMLGIRPDLITFADTGGEKPETYGYLAIINAWLAKVGFPQVTIVRKKVRTGPGSEPYRTLEENMLGNHTLPSLAFGGPGKKACSLKWKVIGVQDAYRDAWQPAKDAWARGARVNVLIGYDAGPKDSRRSSVGDDAKYHYEYPLRLWGWDRDECKARIAAAGLEVPYKSACFFCVAGETEVVTRDGIKPIRELAGGNHKLLVPQVGTLGGLGHRGAFKEVEVRSFGVQSLCEVKLKRGPVKLTVRTTPEHRWFTAAVPGAQWVDPKEFERTTETLRVGDKLRTLRATACIGTEVFMPIACAQGFVFGDGTRQDDRESPASVMIYDLGKDAAMLPLFGMTQQKPYTVNDKPAINVYGLPRFWKDRPPINEPRIFLLSWLAGYFAADGSVDKKGRAVLESATKTNLDFARSIASICGVGCGFVRGRMRVGFPGTEASMLYRVAFRVSDLPEWFFRIEEHKKRAEQERPVGTKKQRHPDAMWVVESVRQLEEREEVFCAVVPGAQAFGLGGDLMTGNCPASKPSEIVEIIEKHPHLADRIIKMEDNFTPGQNAKREKHAAAVAFLERYLRTHAVGDISKVDVKGMETVEVDVKGEIKKKKIETTYIEAGEKLTAAKRASIESWYKRTRKVKWIEGLWGNGVKGEKGAEAKPGSMAVFIREYRAGKHRSLPIMQEEVDEPVSCGVYDEPVKEEIVPCGSPEALPPPGPPEDDEYEEEESQASTWWDR